jgi:hypothetical protein
MQRSLWTMLVVVGIAFAPSIVSAQTQFPIENHYKAYFVEPNPFHPGLVRLVDQFGPSDYTLGKVLNRFSNPVRKNGSEIFFPLVHHTWWFLPSNNQDPIRTVDLDNQFGRQTWVVSQGAYLLAPAAKTLPPQQPPPPLPPHTANHYKCYLAEGPPVNVPVTLVDQFGTTTNVAVAPEWFCNPVAKTVETGETYPIVDPEAHLACYRIDPNTAVFRQLLTTDQFGTWALLAREQRTLCLPTIKHHPIGIESGTWGKVKRLYQ